MAVPRQEVVTLPLPPSLRQSLTCAGFRTVADLHGVGPVDLSAGKGGSSKDPYPKLADFDMQSPPAELGVSPDDALLILKVADVHQHPGLLGGSSVSASNLGCQLGDSTVQIHD